MTPPSLKTPARLEGTTRPAHGQQRTANNNARARPV